MIYKFDKITNLLICEIIPLAKRHRAAFELNNDLKSSWDAEILMRPIENCDRLNAVIESIGDEIHDSMLKWERECPIILGNVDNRGKVFLCQVCICFYLLPT